MTLRNSILMLIFFSLLSLTPTYAQNYTGEQEDIDKIFKNIEAFSQYYKDADYESLSNAYAENAVILPPGDDIIKGRKAIREKWKLPEGLKILDHKISPEEIRIEANYAYDIGYYSGTTQREDGIEVSWKGKYLIVWIKEDTDWKIYADAWNRID